MRRWAADLARAHPEVLGVGYFGSYARGDWGVGSDLDVVIVVEQSAKPFEMRAAAWDTRDLPVPADVLTYSREEWLHLVQTRSAFGTLAREMVWVWGGPGFM